jgi:hypothetical protein
MTGVTELFAGQSARRTEEYTDVESRGPKSFAEVRGTDGGETPSLSAAERMVAKRRESQVKALAKEGRTEPRKFKPAQPTQRAVERVPKSNPLDAESFQIRRSRQWKRFRSCGAMH